MSIKIAITPQENRLSSAYLLPSEGRFGTPNPGDLAESSLNSHHQKGHGYLPIELFALLFVSARLLFVADRLGHLEKLYA